MKNKLEKIQFFVESLEKDQLSERQQTTLVVNPEDVMGGAISNASGCVNDGSCASSINDRKCANAGGCDGSINGRKCNNAPVAMEIA